MFETDLFSIAIYLMNSILGCMYAQRLLGCKYRRIPTVVIWTAVYFAMQLLISETGALCSGHLFWRAAVSLAVFFVMGRLLFHGDAALRLFAAFSFVAGSEIVRFISSALNYILNSIWFSILSKMINRGAVFTPEQSTIWTAVPNAAIISVSILLQFAILGAYLRIITRQLAPSVRRLRPHEKLFLILPSLTVLCIAVTLRLMVISVESGMSVIVYDTVPATRFWVPLICLLLLGVVLSSVVLFQRMLRYHEEERRRVFLEKQLDEMRGEVAEIQDIYSDIRILQHDMRGHLANIHALIRSGSEDRGELSVYMDRMEQTLNRLDFPVKTGSLITDIIISRKRREAEEKGIALTMDFLFPANLQIDAYDIGIVLDNALTNAMEACETAGGIVSLRSYAKGNLFFIELENTYSGDISWDGAGLPVSGKADGKGHGIGLSSIQKCAKKYMGDIDVSISEKHGQKFFQLTVMMNGKDFTPENQ